MIDEQAMKDYVDKRLEEIKTDGSTIYECCRRNLLNELLDVRNIIITNTIKEEESALAV